jgi:hypothetical protein
MEFDRALQQSGRDVLFTDFGDHQPNLEGEVPLRRALEEPRYLTRFTIKGPGPCLGTYRPGKGARHQFAGLAAARSSTRGLPVMNSLPRARRCGGCAAERAG